MWFEPGEHLRPLRTPGSAAENMAVSGLSVQQNLLPGALVALVSVAAGIGDVGGLTTVTGNISGGGPMHNVSGIANFGRDADICDYR